MAFGFQATLSILSCASIGAPLKETFGIFRVEFFAREFSTYAARLSDKVVSGSVLERRVLKWVARGLRCWCNNIIIII